MTIPYYLYGGNAETKQKKKTSKPRNKNITGTEKKMYSAKAFLVKSTMV